jgi:hypothetical protein
VLRECFEWAKSIPVERAQDQAKIGSGKVRLKSDTTISGEGTEFKKIFNVGDCINFVTTKG